MTLNFLRIVVRFYQKRLPLVGQFPERYSQYASALYQKTLKNDGLVCSMSSTGCCYDNAVMESFYHTLKVELIYTMKLMTEQQASNAIFDDIESFYNRQRRHSKLGYLSPMAYEATA